MYLQISLDGVKCSGEGGDSHSRFLLFFFTWLHIAQATEEVNTANLPSLLAAEERREWEDEKKVAGGDRHKTR